MATKFDKQVPLEKLIHLRLIKQENVIQNVLQKKILRKYFKATDDVIIVTSHNFDD